MDKKLKFLMDSSDIKLKYSLYKVVILNLKILFTYLILFYVIAIAN